MSVHMKDRMDYTIIGSEVNLAARLESAADVGGILLANETYSLVKDWVVADEGVPLTVKGFPRPVKTFRVKGTRDRLDAGGQVFRHDTDGISITIDRQKTSKAAAVQELRKVLDQLEE